MGAVFLATHGELHKRVAVKILHPHVAENPVVRERFKREGIAAAELDHPNVVNALDAGELDGVPFLVMEYLEGKTLGKLMKEQFAAGRCLAPAQALELLLPVLEGLAFAHDAGVIHRDLKPENIYLAQLRNGRVEPKILDFGIARIRSVLADHTITSEGSLLGTPAYMSPEQVTDSKRVDARSDQYSITAVIYECVTGHRPIEMPPDATLQRVLNTIAAGVITPPRAWDPRFDPGLEAVLLKGLSQDPARRFASVRELAEALRRAVAVAGERASVTGAVVSVAPPPSDAVVATVAIGGAHAGAGMIDTTVSSSPREIVAPPSPSPKRRVAWVTAAGVAMVGGAMALLLAALATRKGEPAAARSVPHAVAVQATPVVHAAAVVAAATPQRAPAVVVVAAVPTVVPRANVAPRVVRPAVAPRNRNIPRDPWTNPRPTPARTSAVPMCDGVPCPD